MPLSDHRSNYARILWSLRFILLLSPPPPRRTSRPMP